MNFSLQTVKENDNCAVTRLFRIKKVEISIIWVEK